MYSITNDNNVPNKPEIRQKLNKVFHIFMILTKITNDVS